MNTHHLFHSAIEYFYILDTYNEYRKTMKVAGTFTKHPQRREFEHLFCDWLMYSCCMEWTKITKDRWDAASHSNTSKTFASIRYFLQWISRCTNDSKNNNRYSQSWLKSSGISTTYTNLSKSNYRRIKEHLHFNSRLILQRTFCPYSNVLAEATWSVSKQIGRFKWILHWNWRISSEICARTDIRR